MDPWHAFPTFVLKRNGKWETPFVPASITGRGMEPEMPNVAVCGENVPPKGKPKIPEER